MIAWLTVWSEMIQNPFRIFWYEHTYATIVVGSKLSEERTQPISVPQTLTISSHALTWLVHNVCCDFDS